MTLIIFFARVRASILRNLTSNLFANLPPPQKNVAGKHAGGFLPPGGGTRLRLRTKTKAVGLFFFFFDEVNIGRVLVGQALSNIPSNNIFPFSRGVRVIN